jgi:hypothetical protein
MFSWCSDVMICDCIDFHLSFPQTPQGLVLKSFVCSASEGSGKIYDDDGKSTAYDQRVDGYSWTNVGFKVGLDGFTLTFTISPMDGNFKSKPTTRAYQVLLVGSWPASAVTVDGEALTYVPFHLNNVMGESVKSDSWSYNGDAVSLVVNLSPRSTAKSITIVVTSVKKYGESSDICSGIPGMIQRLRVAQDMLDNQWGTPNTVYQQDYVSCSSTRLQSSLS